LAGKNVSEMAYFVLDVI